MIRWTAQTTTRDIDRQPLQRIVIYPEGTQKEEVKREYRYSHKRSLLVRNGDKYRYRQ